MKKNGKGPNEIEIVDASRTERLSSGVEVMVLPFSARLHDSIQSKAQEKFPDPKPPKKIIKVVDGSEEVDDVNNPAYLEEKQEAKTLRDNWVGQRIGENVIDTCLVVDLEPYKSVIERLAKSLEEPVPTDSEELKEFFLTNYALRGRADYERITSVSLALMAVGDKEIAARMDSFRREMARPTDNNPQTPGPNETIRLDLEQS